MFPRTSKSLVGLILSDIAHGERASLMAKAAWMNALQSVSTVYTLCAWRWRAVHHADVISCSPRWKCESTSASTRITLYLAHSPPRWCSCPADRNNIWPAIFCQHHRGRAPWCYSRPRARCYSSACIATDCNRTRAVCMMWFWWASRKDSVTMSKRLRRKSRAWWGTTVIVFQHEQCRHCDLVLALFLHRDELSQTRFGQQQISGKIVGIHPSGSLLPYTSTS